LRGTAGAYNVTLAYPDAPVMVINGSQLVDVSVPTAVALN